MTTGEADGPGAGRGESRRALAVGIALVALYAVLAAWSASLTPLARGPLLDGLAPVNYRWISPPPELEAVNQQPTSGRFVLPLGEDGVGTQVVFTSDAQVTVIVDDGSIGPTRGERSVELLVEPIDPAELPRPGGDLAVFGNAYAVRGSFRPSGDPVRGFDRPMTMVLVYPSTFSLHATTHEMLFSSDGETWEPLGTTDSPGQQQAEADVPGPGYVVVAGVPVPRSPGPAAASDGGTPPLAVALLVAAGVVFVIGLGLLIRARAR